MTINQQEPATAQVELREFMVSMVDISTGHIPRHTAKALGEADSKEKPALWDALSYVYYHEYGWIIYCSPDAPAAVEHEHPELAALIRGAIQSGAVHLKLDADGSVVPDIPFFTWEGEDQK